MGKCAVAYDYCSLQHDFEDEVTEVRRTEKLKQHLESVLPTMYNGIMVDMVESVKKKLKGGLTFVTLQEVEI